MLIFFNFDLEYHIRIKIHDSSNDIYKNKNQLTLNN